MLDDSAILVRSISTMIQDALLALIVEHGSRTDSWWDIRDYGMVIYGVGAPYSHFLLTTPTNLYMPDSYFSGTRGGTQQHIRYAVSLNKGQVMCEAWGSHRFCWDCSNDFAEKLAELIWRWLLAKALSSF